MPLDVRKIVFDLKNLIKGSSLLLVDSLFLIRIEIVNFRMDILPLISSKNSNIYSASYSIFLSYLPLWLLKPIFYLLSSKFGPMIPLVVLCINYLLVANEKPMRMKNQNFLYNLTLNFDNRGYIDTVLPNRWSILPYINHIRN